MVSSNDFREELDRLSSEVFAGHPELQDHRKEFPWLTGALGDPFSPVWFVAENPSLTQVRKAPGTSPEQQWSVSKGDRLFRESLARHGFKDEGAFAAGGWRCYITDVIKSAEVVNIWRAEPGEVQARVAEEWAPVLRYEMEQGQPEYLVVLGEKTERLLLHLERENLIPRLPNWKRIYHYSYIGQRAESKEPPPGQKRRGPGHPERVAEWDAEFAWVAQRALHAREA